MMKPDEYDMIATGWSILIVFLTLFWFVMLRKLVEIVNGRLAETRSHQSIQGMGGMLRFLFRGEFKQTGDERLISICEKLRKLLYAYLGSIGAYLVFLMAGLWQGSRWW